MPTALETLFTDIANAIRAKKSSTGKIVAANFPTEILSINEGSTLLPLNINTNKDGVYLIVSNIEGVEGTTATLSSSRLVSDEFSLYGWSLNDSEDVVSQSSTYTMEIPAQESSVTAIYDVIYILSIVPSISGAKVTITGAGRYRQGALVNINIIPGLSYIFEGWLNLADNKILSKNTSYEFVISGNTNLQAQLITSIAANLIASEDTETLRSSINQTLQVKSTSALGTTYHSKYTGAQINEAIQLALELEEGE